MARKRMFDTSLLDTDNFLDMPPTTQNLYFHIGLKADDDGFVGNVKRIIKIIGSTEEDLKILEKNNYIIVFENGVVVIKHWLINNYIRKDRYIETIYKNEKSQLTTDENGIYVFGQPNDNQMTTKCQPSIVKNSIVKNSKDINNNIISYKNSYIKNYNNYEQRSNIDFDSLYANKK